MDMHAWCNGRAYNIIGYPAFGETFGCLPRVGKKDCDLANIAQLYLVSTAHI